MVEISITIIRVSNEFLQYEPLRQGFRHKNLAIVTLCNFWVSGHQIKNYVQKGAPEVYRRCGQLTQHRPGDQEHQPVPPLLHKEKLPVENFLYHKESLFLRTFYLSWNNGGQPCQGLFSQNAHQSITQLIEIQLLVDLSLFGHFQLALPSGTPLWEDLCPSSWWGGRWLP